MLNSADLSAYLGKVGLDLPLSVSEETLKQVHCAQIQCIPFENFDVLLQREMLLAPPALLQKLVYQQRGGYCFELNGLLLLVLRTLGFDARGALARVHLRGDHLGRTHLMCRVRLNAQEWIADVGFGGGCGLVEPALLQYDIPFEQAGQRLRFVADEGYGTMLQLWWHEHDGDGFWKNIYSFDNEIVDAGDIAMAHHFTATSPQSLFTHTRVVTIPTADGRLSLLNDELKISRNGIDEHVQLPEGEPYLAALERYFGIRLAVDYNDLKPIKKPA